MAGSSAAELPRWGIRPWGQTPWMRMLIPYEPDLGREAINEAIKSRHGVKKVELVKKIIGKNSSMGSAPMEARKFCMRFTIADPLELQT